MKEKDCIFCMLANGDIPTTAVYEDEDFKVILDASPAAKGHALILPKEHFTNLYELDDTVASRVLVVAKKVITELTEKLGCSGYNIVQNNGVDAGQTVFHYHMHLIPRHKNDGIGITWEPLQLTEEEKADVIACITE